MKYLRERREVLYGYLPARLPNSTENLEVPNYCLMPSLKAQMDVKFTTMAFVRVLTAMLKDVGKRVVPIIPDEARTFGMEGLSVRWVFTHMFVEKGTTRC